MFDWEKVAGVVKYSCSLLSVFLFEYDTIVSLGESLRGEKLPSPLGRGNNFRHYYS